MSFSPNPICENAVSVPTNCVHSGRVSFGLLPKDYRADVAQNWRAGLSPGSNIVVYSTTYARGLSTAALSTPRIWWISGPKTSQSVMKEMVREVVGRLPERAGDNYAVFGSYSAAMTFARSNNYVVVNCDYPAYRLGDFNPAETKPVFNLEAGFLPSYSGDATDVKIYNLANPQNSFGSGNLQYAVPSDDFVILSPTDSANFNGIGSEVGVDCSLGGINNTTGSVLTNGFPKGLIFEAILELPGSSTEFTMLDIVDSGLGTNLKLRYTQLSGGMFEIYFDGVLMYQTNGGTSLPNGKYYICIGIPRNSIDANKVKMYVNALYDTATPIEFNRVGSPGAWTDTNNYFSIGSNTSGTEQIGRVFSAKLHTYVGAGWDVNYAQNFYSDNWPIVQNLYSL